MKLSTRRSTALVGAAVAVILCLGGTTTALAVEPSSSAVATAQASATAQEDFRASLIVVSDSGAEPISVTDGSLTVASLLRTRGYDLTDFKDDKGNPLQADQKLKSGERFVVYGSSVEGTSQTIELKLPDKSTDDPTLYKGETVVDSPGKVGSALKTTVIHRDLSKLSSGSTVKVEDLDSKALTADETQTAEESYLTVLEAPSAKVIRVGTKDCGSQYLCDLIESKGYDVVKATGGYVHPLGNSINWTTYYGSKDHEGGAVDFPVAAGTPIHAVADGVVLNSADMGAGGNMATIRHADGTITGYAHMIELPLVKVGEQVKAGQVIGFVGSTGHSTGPHLHFEVWKSQVWGQEILAYEYMKSHGVDLGLCTSGDACKLSEPN